MKKQPAAWRDNTDVQLRNFFSFLALFFFIVQFLTIDKITSLISFKNDR